MKSYIVMLEEGQWDDYDKNPVIVCDNKDKAKKLVNELNKNLPEVIKLFNNFETNFYKEYEKEYPKLQKGGFSILANYEKMRKFWSQLFFIINSNKSVKEISYKEAYGLYDNYYKKENDEKPTFEEFSKWLKNEEKNDHNRIKYFKERDIAKNQARKELMNKFPKHLRKYYFMCSGNSNFHFILMEVDKI